MLALDRPMGVVSGLVLFGDHADPNRIHYAPTRPKLALTSSGEREFSLVKFRPGEASDGGVGLLSFTVDLEASERQREQVLEWLEDAGHTEAFLTPVSWLSGKAVLAAALAEGDGFVEKLQGEATPNLMGNNRAVMSASFTQDGASLIESLIDDATVSPLGVRYELEYAGLRPALDVRIRADYKRIYEEFSWGFEFGVAYEGVGVRAGVESATQKLIENGAIQIEVLHFTDDADLKSRVDEAIRWLQDRILEDFFKDSLKPPAQESMLDKAIAAATQLGAATLGDALADVNIAAQLAEQLGISTDVLGALNRQGGTGGGATSESTFALKLQFTMRDIKQEQLKTMTLDWTEAHAEVRTAAPQGLLADFGQLPDVIKAEERGRWWDKVKTNVRPLGDFEKLGVSRLVVHMAFPDEVDPRDGISSLVFDAAEMEPQLFSRWTDGARPRFRVKPEVHFADDGAWPGPPIFEGAWEYEQTAELAMHPLSSVPRVEVEIMKGSLEFGDSPQVQIEMRVDDRQRGTFMLTEAAPRSVFRFRPAELRMSEPEPDADPDEPFEPVPLPPKVESRLKWFMAGGGSVQGNWSNVEGNTLMVPSPWQGRRQVRIFPMLPGDIIEAIVNISMIENNITRSADPVRFEPGERRAKSVTLPSLAAEAPPLQVSVIVVRGDGTFYVGDPFETTDPVVVVRDREGDARQIKVRLLAGDSLAQHGVLAVQVQLLDRETDEVVDELNFTESSREPQSLLVPKEDEQPGFRYRIVRYGLDAKPVFDDVIETERSEILVPAVAS